MEIIEKFKIVYYTDAMEFLQRMESKTREKIIYNIDKARYTLDPKLFKKPLLHMDLLRRQKKHLLMK
jgi:hypothetical protein